MTVLLEMCLESLEDALAAEAGGADRLELCTALALGGLTPSLGTLCEITSIVRLPVIAMLRPRPGGFCYSDHEFRVMQRDLDLLLSHGAEGVVFGILGPDGTVDVARCRQLLTQIGPKEAVFHRAFDVTPNPFAALEQLIALGFRRLLTSGQEATAPTGTALIAELIRRAAGRIEILPGCGVNSDTVVELVTRTGCTQVHASLRESRLDPSTAARPHVGFGRHEATSAAAVADLSYLLKREFP